MTYDVQRYTMQIYVNPSGWISRAAMERNDDGLYVLADDAEAHERAALARSKDAAATAIRDAADVAYNSGYVDGSKDAREGAIRDCIAAVYCLGLKEWPAVTSALRALLKGEKS